MQIKKNELVKACGTYGERRSAYRVLVGKLEERNHLKDQDRDGEDNIEVDLLGVG
jgi:hypothetical protein